MSRFWKRDGGQSGAPPPPEQHREPAGYWEDRLHAIGARIDAMSAIMNDLVVSIAAGDVWVTALESNETRAQPGWDIVARRIEGVGAQRSSTQPVPAARAGTFAAIGRALDRDRLLVREPCIMHLGSQVLITALVQRGDDWHPANWNLNERGELV